MNNKIGIAAIIFGVSALVTALTTAVVNFMTLKWGMEAYKPFGRFMKKSEPMFDKLAVCGEKMVDEYIREMED